MRRAALLLSIFGAGLGAACSQNEITPAAPPPAAEKPSDNSLQAMLETGHRARTQPSAAPQSGEERRRKIEGELLAGDPAARRAAFRALILEDRSAAVVVARQRLRDPALFVDCARLLLEAPAPDSRDVVQVRKILRTAQLDEPTRAAVSILVLETLVRIHSPAAAGFAADLLRSPSVRVRAATPKVLVAMAEGEQVPLLIGALADREAQVRQAARAQLSYVAKRDLGESPAAWTAWWKARSASAKNPSR